MKAYNAKCNLIFRACTTLISCWLKHFGQKSVIEFYVVRMTLIICIHGVSVSLSFYRVGEPCPSLILKG